MLWIYQRGPEDLRLVTTFDNATKKYVITIIRPHKTTCERFTDGAAFQLRLEALEGKMQTERWCRVRHPVILHDGWKVG